MRPPPEERTGLLLLIVLPVVARWALLLLAPTNADRSVDDEQTFV